MLSGSHSLELRSLTTSTKWAFQAVGVTAGSHYAASGHAWHADSDTDAVFLRVSWYATSDGSGEAISTVDSLQLLEPAQPIWRELSTGAVLAPGGAQSARVRLMLRPEGGAEATAYFDDIEFVQTAPPLVPTPTATAAPGETAPPPAKSPTPKSSLAPSAAPTFAPPDEEDDEPGHFQALTNGGFEDVREDGSPYGWRKQGGEFAADDSSTAEGALALLMRSESTSTKWVHQAVSVSGGAWYEFSGFASAPGGGTELFLRVAWYASNNASGSALASEDSTTSVVGPVSGYHYLTTGAIHAPVEARSARLRLMLRPAGSGEAIGYFDALRFEVTAPAPGGSASSVADAAGSSRGSGSVTSGGSEVSEEGSKRAPVLGVLATPFDVSNVAGDGSGDESLVDGDSGSASRPWIWLAIAVPVVGLAAIGAVEVRRWASRRGEEFEQEAEE
ncbi:MAG TPA: hypothetical protein VMR52_09235 [Dehalococcoidia bacterium]|nr:hypothetical protein [Dehalococcoidia bacterium]